MNIFVGICSVLLSTIIGYLSSQKYRLIKDFYLSFSAFNKRLLNDIGFYQKSLIGIFNDYNDENDFFICAKAYVVMGESIIKKKYMTSDDFEFFEKYLKELGNVDKSLQLKHLSSYDELILDKLKISAENEKKFKNLYLKLGLLIGIILFIIVI